MRFYRTNVAVGKVVPPEEILSALTGACGLWQIAVVTISCISFFFHGLNRFSIRYGSPPLNYTCKNGNGSQCFDVNGSLCEEFEFINKPTNLITWTEKLLLVCDKKEYTFWVETVYRTGQLVGALLLGHTVDRFGIKAAAMVFIPLDCLTGLFTIAAATKVEVLMAVYFFHGSVTTSLRLLPVIAVCDSVGNNWRTFSLGILMVSENISLAIFTAICEFFSDLGGIIATNSSLPLILLVPLLYYKDSPNYINIATDYVKYEDILRQIGKINKRPISSDAKIRPVQVVTGRAQPERSTNITDLFRSKTTAKAYAALSVIHFLVGYNINIIMEQTELFSNSQTFILALYRTIGCSICVGVCHLLPHRILYGIISFARNLCVAGFFLFRHEFFLANSRIIDLLVNFASIFNAMCHLILISITPRMFPTEYRARCVGFCIGILYCGTVASQVIHYLAQNSMWSTLGIVVTCPILETLCSFFLWEVHKRELPDFVMDCIRFEKYHKPTRYYLIYDVPSEHEIEVRRIALNQEESDRYKQTGRFGMDISTSEGQESNSQ